MTKPYWIKFEPAKHVLRTLILNRSARCAYYDLRNSFFQHGGFLPDDNEVLSQATGASLEEWLTIRPVLELVFTIDIRGWHDQDLLAEMRDTNEKIAARKAAGSKGGRAKAMNGKANRKPSNARRLPYHIESDLH